MHTVSLKFLHKCRYLYCCNGCNAITFRWAKFRECGKILLSKSIFPYSEDGLFTRAVQVQEFCIGAKMVPVRK